MGYEVGKIAGTFRDGGRGTTYARNGKSVTAARRVQALDRVSISEEARRRHESEQQEGCEYPADRNRKGQDAE
jgi:hypothetical protein